MFIPRLSKADFLIEISLEAICRRGGTVIPPVQFCQPEQG
jgi:hypothetical protein